MNERDLARSEAQTESEVDVDLAAIESRSGSILERLSLSAIDATCLVGLGLLLIAFVPALTFAGWTPRMAILLGLLPFGLACLTIQARDRDRVALVAVAAAAWAVVSGIVSANPRTALLGVVGRDLSVLVLVAVLGLWSLSRSMTTAGRSMLLRVAVACLTVNAVIGIVQVALQLKSGSLALYSGRASGLFVNPVYFGALSASGTVGAFGLVNGSRRWAALISVFACSAATDLSGSRIALLALVVVGFILYPLIQGRSHRLTAVVGMLGVACGEVFNRLIGNGQGAAARFVSESGGGRTQVWRYALAAWWDRPITGHGLGRFRPAVQSRFSIDFVRTSARDDLTQAWFDAHNVLLNTLVGVGIVGFALLAYWLLLVVRRSSGPLAWMLLPIGLTWMLQPAALATLPVAAILLGASSADMPGRARAINRPVKVAVLSVGTLVAVWLLLADIALTDAVGRLDAEAAGSRSRMFIVDDPVVTDVIAQIYDLTASDMTGRLRAIEWHEKATRAEPDRPYWWSSLALGQIAAGQFNDAELSLQKARALQATNPTAAQYEVLLALVLEDSDRLETALATACELDLPECGLDAAELLVEYRDRGSAKRK